MNLETLETYSRRLCSVTAKLAQAVDQLVLIADAVPAPEYDEESSEPLNAAAEIQLACRMAIEEELKPAVARLSKMFDLKPSSDRGVATG